MKQLYIYKAEQMQKEIEASHKRSKEYGISTEERSASQKRLLPEELEERIQRSRNFLEVSVTHVAEIYSMLQPSDFMVMIVDHEGYILHMEGSSEAKDKFAERNCAPGFRWTERDVGTSATSLCLEILSPVQLNDRDHYCTRAYGFTSSAAPVFSHDGQLLGILVVSGSAGLVHTHTLYMLVSAARSIERQMLIARHHNELAKNIGFLDNVIEAAGTGLLVLDRDMVIQKLNQKGKKIIGTGELNGKPITSLGDIKIDLASIRNTPSEWVNRECHLSHSGKDIHFLFTARPVLAKNNDMLGAVLAFEEIDAIRQLADTIAGSKPFYTFEQLIGKSPVFEKAISIARRASQNEAVTLLRGETGTGKELFAQSIHNAGHRRNKPFVPINCGAIPRDLLESELFGYVQGAFTGAQKGGKPGKFELAHGGTLLLDEIGDMPHDMQVKLLRVLQTGEVYRIGAQKPLLVNVRIIASTHVDLTKAVAAGNFREDLFYRLNVFPINIPPLRLRGREDILALADYFLKRNRVSPPQMTEAALDALAEYSWPGNVRELENTVERAFYLSTGPYIDTEDFSFSCAENNKIQPILKCRPYSGTLAEIEREVIENSLEQTKSNMAATAKILGISRATLYRKLKDYSLT